MFRMKPKYNNDSYQKHISYQPHKNRWTPSKAPDFTVAHEDKYLDFNHLSTAARIVYILAIFSLLQRQAGAVSTGKTQHTGSLPIAKSTPFSNVTITQTFSIPTSTTITCAQASMILAPDNYFGLTVIDVSRTISDCGIKSVGSSDGKICLIKNQKYMLKPVIDNWFNSYSSYLDAWHNTQLLRNNIGIRVPESAFFSETDGEYQVSSFIFGDEVRKSDLYYGSAFIENFEPILNIYTRIRLELFQQESNFMFFYHSIASSQRIRDTFTRAVYSQIGEEGVAKLIVASTFVGDLANNFGNWGFVGNELAIVDMDMTKADSTSAGDMLSNLHIDLTLRTVELMKDIYKNMLTRKAPERITKSIGWTQVQYENLVRSYLNACYQASRTMLDQDDIPFFAPSKEINRFLARSFYDIDSFINQAYQFMGWR